MGKDLKKGLLSGQIGTRIKKSAIITKKIAIILIMVIIMIIIAIKTIIISIIMIRMITK